MSHLEEVERLNGECWARAKAALFLELGREPTATEVGLYVMQSQLYVLVMLMLPDPQDRITWFKGAIQVIAQGRPTGVPS